MLLRGWSAAHIANDLRISRFLVAPLKSVLRTRGVPCASRLNWFARHTQPIPALGFYGGCPMEQVLLNSKVVVVMGSIAPSDLNDRETDIGYS